MAPKYPQTQTNIKNKGSTHSPPLPPSWGWGFFCYSLWTETPPPHSQQIWFIFLPSGSQSLSPSPQGWEGTQNSLGSPRLVAEPQPTQEMLWCHVFGTSSSQIHHQARYSHPKITLFPFQNHIIPTPKSTPTPCSVSVRNSHLPDSEAMAHLIFGHSPPAQENQRENLAASKGK